MTKRWVTKKNILHILIITEYFANLLWE